MEVEAVTPVIPDSLSVAVSDGQDLGQGRHTGPVDETRSKVILGEGEVKTWGHSLTGQDNLVARTVGHLGNPNRKPQERSSGNSSKALDVSTEHF